MHVQAPLSSTTLVCCLEQSNGRPMISTSTKGSMIWKWRSDKNRVLTMVSDGIRCYPLCARHTSPLSPNMESLGFGSCCPLMIFNTNWVFLRPGRGSSKVGLKAPEKTKEHAKKLTNNELLDTVHGCIFTFTHALGLQNISTVTIGWELCSIQFQHSTFCLIIQSH